MHPLFNHPKELTVKTSFRNSWIVEILSVPETYRLRSLSQTPKLTIEPYLQEFSLHCAAFDRSRAVLHVLAISG